MAPCRVRSGHSRAEDDLVPVQRWNKCAERGVGLWHWELWKIDRLLHCRLHFRQWTCDQQPQVRVTSVSVVPWWDRNLFFCWTCMLPSTKVSICRDQDTCFGAACYWLAVLLGLCIAEGRRHQADQVNIVACRNWAKQSLAWLMFMYVTLQFR